MKGMPAEQSWHDFFKVHLSEKTTTGELLVKKLRIKQQPKTFGYLITTPLFPNKLTNELASTRLPLIRT